jgi:hypothetical protein
MENKKLLFLLLMGINGFLFAQDPNDRLHGTISFIASENIYVRFPGTTLIEAGDTLFLEKDGQAIPCLVVISKSSISCIAKTLTGCEVEKNDPVFFQLPANDKEIETENKVTEQKQPFSREDKIKEKPSEKPPSKSFKERINGRISAASYSVLSDQGNPGYHNAVGRVSLNAEHIDHSRFSVYAYLNHRQKIKLNEEGPASNEGAFRIYNLAVRYEANHSLSFLLGRQINNKFSSLGAFDGLQVEKGLKNFYGGALIGSRPDIYDFSYNPKLFSYGVYGGYRQAGDKLITESTLGVLEQRNSGAIDRRFFYFQHSGSFLGKLHLFVSTEMDLFQNLPGISGSKPRLTSLYVSTRYRLHQKISLMASYDTRKNIIYYETYSSEIERLLDDDIARQGFRLRINVQPLRQINAGASAGSRFQSDNRNKSTNVNGFIHFTRLPLVDGGLNLNYNLTRSNYLESRILSVTYSRQLINKLLNGYVYYRRLNYAYLIHEKQSPAQQYYGAKMSLQISRDLSFGLMGEISERDTDTNYRVNTNLIKRFRK